jgi:hypothetical protein
MSWILELTCVHGVFIFCATEFTLLRVRFSLTLQYGLSAMIAWRIWESHTIIMGNVAICFVIAMMATLELTVNFSDHAMI